MHVAQETINCHREVKIFGGQEYEARRFDRANQKQRGLRDAADRRRFRDDADRPDFHVYRGRSDHQQWRCSSPAANELSVGDFVSFLAAMLLLLAPIKHLTEVSAPLQRGLASAESVFELLDERPEQDTGTRILPRARGRIQYERVSFAYPGTGREAVDEVSVSVEPGETIALRRPLGRRQDDIRQSAAAILRGDGRPHPDRWDRHERDCASEPAREHRLGLAGCHPVQRLGGGEHRVREGGRCVRRRARAAARVRSPGAGVCRREAHAVLADQGVEPSRHLADEIQRVAPRALAASSSAPDAPPALPYAMFAATESLNRVTSCETKAMFARRLASAISLVSIPSIRIAAARRLVESRQQIDECRLAAARGADEGDRFARFNADAHLVDGLPAGCPGTRTIPARTGSAPCARRNPGTGVLLGRSSEQLEPLSADRGAPACSGALTSVRCLIGASSNSIAARNDTKSPTLNSFAADCCSAMLMITATAIDMKIWTIGVVPEAATIAASRSRAASDSRDRTGAPRTPAHRRSSPHGGN